MPAACASARTSRRCASTARRASRSTAPCASPRPSMPSRECLSTSRPLEGARGTIFAPRPRLSYDGCADRGASVHILLVEDDVEAAGHVGDGLREAGYAVHHCADGQAGLAAARAARYDLLIVDRMLPHMDGLSIVARLRLENVPTPVLLLSALGTIDDRVEGLRAGGDDYLVKPFAFAELLARFEALLRRASCDSRHVGVLRVADLEMNLLSRRVTRAGRNIDLTAKEFQLLEFLVRRVSQIVTRTM